MPWFSLKPAHHPKKTRHYERDRAASTDRHQKRGLVSIDRRTTNQRLREKKTTGLWPAAIAAAKDACRSDVRPAKRPFSHFAFWLWSPVHSVKPSTRTDAHCILSRLRGSFTSSTGKHQKRAFGWEEKPPPEPQGVRRPAYNPFLPSRSWAPPHSFTTTARQ